MARTRPPVGILGGGPAGLATAIALRKLGLHACVIEKGSWGKPRAGEHLAADAQIALARLGLAELCDHARACRGIVSAWGSSTPEVQELHLRAPMGGGFLLDRAHFDRGMLQHAIEHDVACMANTRFMSATRLPEPGAPGGVWRATLRSGPEELEREFSWLVDATGRTARLARGQNARVVVHDRLVGVTSRTAPMGTRGPADDWLRIWSEPDGWWYLATLPGGERIATWMTDAQRVGRLARSDSWRDHCARHFAAADPGMRVPPGLATAPWERPRSWPAHTQYLEHPCGAGWLAVGDAALAFDPLSSAGIAKALRDGWMAAEAIAQALTGRKEALPHYEDLLLRARQRYLDQRCHYYRLERRFPTEFWRQRQHEPLHREAVTLDPRKRLQPTRGATAATAAQALAARVPSIDGALLFELLASGDVAHRLVRATVSRMEVDDHAAIIALQVLLEGGILATAANP